MNKVIITQFLLVLTLFSVGCHRESLDKKTCQDLLFKTYKGFPFEAKKFKSNCLDHTLEITMQSCKDALSEMVMGKGKVDLQQKYGQDILKCFSKNDLKKFLIR